jgi:hypothetical protein
MFFHIQTTDKNITFTPKPFIRDILEDYSNSLIPFTNGKRYYVYQDMIFQLLDLFEKMYPTLNIQIYTDNTNENGLQFIIHNVYDNQESIIKDSNDILTNYINKKFSLFI